MSRNSYGFKTCRHLSTYRVPRTETRSNETSTKTFELLSLYFVNTRLSFDAHKPMCVSFEFSANIYVKIKFLEYQYLRMYFAYTLLGSCVSVEEEPQT